MHGHGLQPPSGRPQSNEFHNFTQWGQEIRKYPCFHCTFNLFKQCYMLELLAQLQIGIQWPTKLILVWANKMFVVVGV